MGVKRRSRASRRPGPTDLGELGRAVEGRRGFLVMCLGAGAAFAAPVLRILDGVLPARYVEAVRPRPDASPARTPDLREIARPARWAG